MPNQVIWVEVWMDGFSKRDFIYLLLLQASSGGTFDIIDPQEQGRKIKSFNSYEDAEFWLEEEEYELVEGRRELEE